MAFISLQKSLNVLIFSDKSPCNCIGYKFKRYVTKLPKFQSITWKSPRLSLVFCQIIFLQLWAVPRNMVFFVAVVAKNSWVILFICFFWIIESYSKCTICIIFLFFQFFCFCRRQSFLFRHYNFCSPWWMSVYFRGDELESLGSCYLRSFMDR